ARDATGRRRTEQYRLPFALTAEPIPTRRMQAGAGVRPPAMAKLSLPQAASRLETVVRGASGQQVKQKALPARARSTKMSPQFRSNHNNHATGAPPRRRMRGRHHVG